MVISFSCLIVRLLCSLTCCSRINHRVFRYNTDSLILRDIKWRNQCRLARSLEPCHYGVPTEYYVSKNDRLSASNGRNDRNDSSSIASSEKNSKALPPSTSTCNNENHSLGGGISLRSRFADLSFSSVFPYGSCYAKASRIFSMMSTALTPKVSINFDDGLILPAKLSSVLISHVFLL